MIEKMIGEALANSSVLSMLVELAEAVRAADDASGTIIHKPAGQKPRPAFVIPEALWLRVREALEQLEQKVGAK